MQCTWFNCIVVKSTAVDFCCGLAYGRRQRTALLFGAADCSGLHYFGGQLDCSCSSGLVLLCGTVGGSGLYCCLGQWCWSPLLQWIALLCGAVNCSGLHCYSVVQWITGVNYCSGVLQCPMQSTVQCPMQSTAVSNAVNCSWPDHNVVWHSAVYIGLHYSTM